ncbi:MAG TPA: CoA transferase [Kineosporiaceae bacterium]|nr:CoA transferase [Kineosporiaceae bacterium]
MAGIDPALPSVFRVGTAAVTVVTTALRAAAAFWADSNAGGAANGVPAVRVGVREAVAAFRSERYLTLGGAVGSLWEPLSGDYRTADGWVRLHCNFPHHATAACRALGVAPERDAVTRAIAGWYAQDVEQAVIDAGGAAGALRTSTEWAAHPQAIAVASTPVVSLRRVADGPPAPAPRAAVAAVAAVAAAARTPDRPLAGVRVLDLTRVIAGPVCGRVLSSLGADVLCVRAPHLPTMPWADIDTGFGKRLRWLDLRDAADREAFFGLVRGADLVVQSYRPGALDRLGLGPADLAAVRPGLGHVSVSAYGDTGPWAGRRGFDSLVQMVTGIADAGMRAAGADRPVPLPAQALDHAAGWLAAAASIDAVRRARADGGSWTAQVTLAGVARWLQSLGRLEPAVGLAAPDPGPADVADLKATMWTPAGELSYVRPPGTIGGVAPSWESPTPFPLTAADG